MKIRNNFLCHYIIFSNHENYSKYKEKSFYEMKNAGNRPFFELNYFKHKISVML